MARLEPLSLDQVDGLAEVEQTYQRTLGFVPNGLRIMARRPEIVQGFIALRRAVLDPASGTVPAELKNLCAHLASRSHGCRYCQAHSLQGAARAGAATERLEAVWEYQDSPLFSEAEKAALDFSVKAASVPNAVTDADVDRLLEHWDEGQVVEILAAVSLYGFLNRFNDSLATPLEEGSAAFAEEAMGERGWTRGKHA
ncbi:MAG: carboxymuconolactone decarboxylase family protein [Candidatus Limnocylindrales bacterium]